jgi:type IV pilus assembly protein PilB
LTPNYGSHTLVSVAKKKLGEILIEEGLIDEHDLEQALEYKEKSGYRLGTALVALRVIAEWQLTEALGKALHLPVVDLVGTPPRKSALQRIPAQLAERFDLIPLRLEGKGANRQLIIAMSDPLNRPVIKRMQNVAGCPIKPVLASLSAIQRAIRNHYHNAEKSKTFTEAEKLRTTHKRAHPKVKTLDANWDVSIAQFFEELKKIRTKKRVSRKEFAEYLLALEFKIRSLLHLMMKKRIISEREYAETLKHFIDTSD